MMLIDHVNSIARQDDKTAKTKLGDDQNVENTKKQHTQ